MAGHISAVHFVPRGAFLLHEQQRQQINLFILQFGELLHWRAPSPAAAEAIVPTTVD